MKPPTETLFDTPSKAEKKREKKRIRKLGKALKKELKTMQQTGVTMPQSSMADILVALAGIRTSIDSMIQFLTAVR